MTLLINLVGLLLIVFIIGWFWFSKTKTVKSADNALIKIKVKEGVYEPARIQVKVNAPITLQFIREDANPCAETVNFPDLQISKTLPLHQTVDIPLTFAKTGEYAFTCQMGMYRGTVVVV